MVRTIANSDHCAKVLLLKKQYYHVLHYYNNKNKDTFKTLKHEQLLNVILN
jgi:hypothetical protein